MTYTRSETRVSGAALRAMAERGVGREWTHPGTGKVRRYLNAEDLGSIIGLEVSYYKTGRCSGCSYAALDGRRVVVAHARGWSDYSKVYVEGDGTVCSDWEPEGDCIAELVAVRANELYGGVDPDAGATDVWWVARAEEDGYVEYRFGTEREAAERAAELNERYEGRGYRAVHVAVGRVTGRVTEIGA